MRPIHAVRLDKWRPAVLLTREIMLPVLNQVTVVPITTKIRGASTEVLVGPRNGLDHDCIANCDIITTVMAADIGKYLGSLLDEQEPELTAALTAAFDLH